VCGIVGIFNRSTACPVAAGQINTLLGPIRHRGPESAGILLAGPLGLGHARLSIIDLPGGQQPIANEDGTIWIVCNGEIFNHVELRAALRARGHHFATGSDCEVLVHLYEEQGPRCLEACIGQFALALWDSRRQTLLLARDRFGVRPLFYTEVNGSLLFASEIKALLADPRVTPALDLATLNDIFTFWAPLPGLTAFQGVRDLPPAHYLVVEPGHITLHRYWSVDFTPVHGSAKQTRRDYAEQLLSLLVDATQIRLRADVPIGAYLSGGLDSAAIATLVQRQTNQSLRTFSIAFDDPQFDERGPQRIMAEYLGTDHVSVFCTDADIARVFPAVVQHAEVPLLRTAPAPMYLLAQAVHAHGLKVVLTGEGADEFLGGYDLFKEARIRRWWAARPDSALRPRLLARLYADIPGLADLPVAYRSAFFKPGLTALDDVCYSHRVRWHNGARLKRLFSAETRHRLALADQDTALYDGLAGLDPHWDPLSQAQFIESRLFLSQYLLSAQGDRMAMAHAVEGRFPFLDHRLVEFAATIPPALRLHGLDEKYILKRAMADLLPASVLARRKRPYRAPIRNVFFGAQALPYVTEMLLPETIRRAGVFDPLAVERLVAKCRAAPVIGEVDGMALVGVLSTQLLYAGFVAQDSAYRQHPAPVHGVVIERDCLQPAYAMAAT